MKKLILCISGVIFISIFMVSSWVHAVSNIYRGNATWQPESHQLHMDQDIDSILIMFISKDNLYDSTALSALKQEGYKVVTTYPNPLKDNQVMIDSLNKADLVIIGRSSTSSDLASSKSAWNHLTIPLMLMSQHSSASDKLNWLNTTQIPHVMDTVNINGYTSHRNDTVFYGVTFASGDTLDWAVAPEDLVILNSPTNGTVLVKTDFITNAVLVVRFETGQAFYSSTCDKPFGPRTFFATGLNTGGILNPFPLTGEAKKVWLAEIKRLVTTTYSPYIPSTDTTLSDLTIGLGIMDPVFHKDTTEYSATLPAGTTSVRIVATPSSCAGVTGAGNVDVSSGSRKVEIIVTAEDGLTTGSYFINFTVTPATINENKRNDVSIFPNPAASAIKVSLSSEYLGAELKLMNVIGEVILKRTVENETETINILGLKPGVYIINIHNNLSSRSVRVIIN